MIDFSHTARHGHYLQAPGLRAEFPVMIDADRFWATIPAGRIVLYPVGPAGRGAHRPAPVSLVKSTV